MSAEMPPRIWVWPDPDQKTWGGWTANAGDEGDTEFVRADIADGLLEALNNLAVETRHMLRANPSKDGGLYRQRLSEAEAAIARATPVRPSEEAGR